MRIKTSEEIIKTLQANRPSLKKFGVRRLGLFGSFSRGDAQRTSDLDFVVDFEKKSFDAYMDLKELLEKLFHCPVDLVLSSSIKPRLREKILKETIYAQGL